MEAIADLTELRPILDSLCEKQLVVSLTPPGRGQVVTHNLYSAERMDRLKQQYASERPPAPTRPATSPKPAAVASPDEFAELKAEVAQLRAELQQLAAEVAALRQGGA